MKKKLIFFAISLLLVIGIAIYCSTRILSITLTEVESIVVKKRNIGIRLVSDAEIIAMISNSITSSVFIKEKPEEGSIAGFFEFQIHGTDGSWTDIAVVAPNKVVINGCIFKAIFKNAIDFSFLDDLFPDKDIAISLSIKEGTLSSTNATLVYTNNSKVKVLYGEGFIIAEKTDGAWVDMDTVIDNYGFHDIGYTLGEMQTKEIETNWEWLYGKLTPGDYRITTSLVISYGNDCCNYLRSAEFTIDSAY